MLKTWGAALLVTAMTITAGCSGGGGAKTVSTAQAGDKQVAIATPTGQLTDSQTDLTVTFTDASGQPVDVQAPTIRFHMPAMPGMGEMNAEPSLAAAGQPGVFKAQVDLPMKGAWHTTVSFKDQGGSRQATFNLQAQ